MSGMKSFVTTVSHISSSDNSRILNSSRLKKHFLTNMYIIYSVFIYLLGTFFLNTCFSVPLFSSDPKPKDFVKRSTLKNTHKEQPDVSFPLTTTSLLYLNST